MVSDSDLPLKYVVLRHEGVNPPHFDLMFETSRGSELATWQSAIWPVCRRTSLTRIGDHRRAYLTYEGAISDNRGWVKRVGWGDCRVQRMTETLWFVEFPGTPLPALTVMWAFDDQWEAWPHESSA